MNRNHHTAAYRRRFYRAYYFYFFCIGIGIEIEYEMLEHQSGSSGK